MAGMKRKPGALPTVQETLLKRRKAAMEARSARARQQVNDRRLARKRRARGSGFVRIERLVKQGRLKERDTIRLERLIRRSPAVADAAPTPATPSAGATGQPDERPLLIVRCRGRASGVDPRVSRALRLFRLSRLNTAVFARPTPACLAVLRLLGPFVAWGAPDMRSVRELVYKRARVSINGAAPAPLTDNASVETALGEHGLLCIEDLVHELATCGPAFVQAATFLLPMRLRAPLGGWRKAEARYRDPSSSGQPGLRPLACSRDEYINGLLREMI